MNLLILASLASLAMYSSISLFVVRTQSGQNFQDEPSDLKVINIGLVLSPENSDHNNQSQLLSAIITQLKRINSHHFIGQGHKLELVTTLLEPNPIRMSKIICEQIIGNPSGGVSAVIVDTDPNYVASIESISFTLALYNIPVIGTTLRDASWYDRNIHSSYISLIPPHSHQADVWYHILKELRFNRAIVLISSENRDLLSRFVHLIDEQDESSLGEKTEIESILEYDADQHKGFNSAWTYFADRISSILENSISRVFLIHAQRENDVRFFLKLIEYFNMTSESFALILSEEFVEVAQSRKLSVPVGSLWSKLSMSNKNAYTLDALEIVALGITNLMMYKNQIDLANTPNSCSAYPSSGWHTGSELYLSILKQSFPGRTGPIIFDEEHGDRLTSSYIIFNTKMNQDNPQIGIFKNGNLNESNLAATPRISKISIDVNRILWPGETTGKLISGIFVSSHLRIVTLKEKPFIWATNERECIGTNQSSIHNYNSVTCKELKSDRSEESLCCKGYCVDLLKEIAHKLNFSYDLYLVHDNLYGSLEYKTYEMNDEASISNGSMQILDKEFMHMHPEMQESQLEWTGLMGELVSRRADMAFAPLTITPQRAQAIDFSKPFKFHRFNILLRKAAKHTTLASFLQPFHNQLWLLVIGVATHVVALAIYLLDRYSTFGHFGIEQGYIPRTPHENREDRPLNLSNSLWFSWSILLNSGIGEHTPKALSGRLLGIIWAGFSMIVVASYTANLAAFLVLDTREETPTVSGIDDPRLRSGDLAFNFATVKGSAVDAYLQSQVEYINLYRKMEEFNFENVDESILALRSGIIDALIWDSTRLEWEVANDALCSLAIAGESFGSSGYAVGLQKGSYWTKNVTTKLLELSESGFMIELDKKWITTGEGLQSEAQAEMPGGGHCDHQDSEDFPETLGISNILGVFILFICGLVTSLGLIGVERLCFKHRVPLLNGQKSWWRRKISGVQRSSAGISRTDVLDSG